MIVNRYITIIIAGCVALNLSAQNEKKLVRQGNQQYEKKKYSDAEVLYKKALEKEPGSISASYNLGNALYRQEKLEDAAEQYTRMSVEKKLSKNELAMIYHNMGNAYLKQQKILESIEAYKKALKNNPSDLETKYNLSFAQHLLKQQQNNENNQEKELEPSEYAKKIKKQADELVAQRKYSGALELMNNLIQKDPTGIYYQDYVKRLKDVVQINSI
jgi:tetratricopeptide (TPR) repeat protein